MENKVKGWLIMALLGIMVVWLSRRRAAPTGGDIGESSLQPSVSEVKSYAGYVVLRAEPQTLSQLEALTKQAFNLLPIAVDFWQEARAVGAPVVLMLEGGEATEVARRHLEVAGVPFREMIPDVQASIDETRPRARAASSSFALDEYHSYGEITAWMEDVASRLDGVEAIEIGPTMQNRIIKGLKINVASGAQKPILFLVCGMHAREWIAPASCIYVAHHLAHGLADESTQAFEWHIVPSINADGYEYSRSHDRLWRKNRRHLPGFLCGYGVDLERNFNWAACQEEGSQFCASDTYCGGGGRHPSENETINLVQYLRDIGGENGAIQGFVDIHSFSQLWMWPWGYTTEPTKAADAAVQAQCGNAAADALYKVHNTSFKTGPIASTIYEVGGSSVDWTYGRFGIMHSYAVELRDRGEYGFLLPEDQIIPTGEELLVGLTSMAACIRETAGTHASAPKPGKLVAV